MVYLNQDDSSCNQEEDDEPFSRSRSKGFHITAWRQQLQQAGRLLLPFFSTLQAVIDEGFS